MWFSYTVCCQPECFLPSLSSLSSLSSTFLSVSKLSLCFLSGFSMKSFSALAWRISCESFPPSVVSKCQCYLACFSVYSVTWSKTSAVQSSAVVSYTAGPHHAHSCVCVYMPPARLGFYNNDVHLMFKSFGAWFRSRDLRVMGPPRYHCATPNGMLT